MTEKARHIIKMFIAMVLIVSTPTLFFSSIGDNPFSVRTGEARKIAVVNEDLGAEKSESQLTFGQEVVSVLSEDSPYEWTVSSRSTAVNGLKKKEYDAIIYIPSDFSENIMSYEQLNPEKAEFRYTIQDQLNAVNRERVVREINAATSRVNSSISTLYWSYVAQDLEGVRTHFDTILEKEMEFLNTMHNFYAPSSQSLAQEIEQQKNMLATIQSSVKSNVDITQSNSEQAVQFEQSLATFVDYVERYKEYQDQQQELLRQLQQNSIEMVSYTLEQQSPRYLGLRTYYLEKSEDITKNFGVLGTNLIQNQKSFAELSAVRIEQIARQRDDLIQSRRVKEDREQEQLITRIVQLKETLETGNGNEPSLPEIPPVDSYASSETQVEKTTAPASSLSLEAERVKLTEVVSEINKVSASLKKINEDEVVEITSAIAILQGLTERMHEIKENLIHAEKQKNPLQGTVSELEKQVAQLKEQVAESQVRVQSITEQYQDRYLTVFNSQIDPILREIANKEVAILQSGLLSPTQKEKLETAFAQAIIYSQPDVVLSYYSELVKFENAILSSLKKKENYQSFITSLNSILGIKKEEQELLDKLLMEMPEANDRFSELQEETSAFLDDFHNKIQVMHLSMEEELSSIQESAHHVMQKMQDLVSDQPVQGGELQAGEMLVSNQQSIGDGLLTMKEALSNIDENQTNVMAYTDELNDKVRDIQVNVNELNEKWSDNVAATQLYRDDIFKVLGNAFVDGQKNGQVYHHLASPLQVSSQVAAQSEEYKVPPVVVLVIILISSLLIGFFSHYFATPTKLVKAAMFTLLNLAVGLIISMYGMDIYPLAEQSAIQWTVFTVLLLTTASAVVMVGFFGGRLIGWLVSVGLVIFFVSPLLALTAPNIGYEDPMSKVYLSIQYGPEDIFLPAVSILIGMLIILTLIPYGVKTWKNRKTQAEDGETYEVS